LEPRNVCTATKVHQEHLAAAFRRETGTPVISLRYHNVYGPRMPRDTPYAGVASLFASALAAGAAPRVFEDGGQRRDFVHVRDVARANVLALAADGSASGAFNVASGRPGGVGELAHALADAAGAQAPRPVITGEYRRGAAPGGSRRASRPDSRAAQLGPRHGANRTTLETCHGPGAHPRATHSAIQGLSLCAPGQGSGTSRASFLPW
jgi:nucleoside-diphosphate-sugar epimerase